MKLLSLSWKGECCEMMNYDDEEREVTYRYEVWYDGCCLHEEGSFEDDEEARDDADLYVESRLDYWEEDGVITESERDVTKAEFQVEVEEE